MSIDAAESGLTPERAFPIRGNPIRAAILRALWSAPGDALSFSELRRRAGNPDSGQFNYHLGEPVGTFIERPEVGYRPVQTGMRVARTALFGDDGASPTLDESLRVVEATPVRESALADDRLSYPKINRKYFCNRTGFCEPLSHRWCSVLTRADTPRAKQP